MALPRRKSSAAAARQSATRSIPEAEESSPWCIDYGDAIDVMRTDEVRFAVTRGYLDTEHKAWRDGRACWLPIADLPELRTPLPSQVEQSGARRIARRPQPDDDVQVDDDPLPDFKVPLMTPRSALLAVLTVLTLVACLVAGGMRAGPARSIGAHLTQALR